MKDRFQKLTVEERPVIAGVQIGISALLWAIVQAAANKTPDQVAILVLGQLSPACAIDEQDGGLTYPDDYGADELLRYDRVSELAGAVQQRQYVELRELLESRIGTPQTYSIVLAIALTMHGHQCQVAVTSENADPPSYTFVTLGKRQIDLYAMAHGRSPQTHRVHRSTSI